MSTNWSLSSVIPTKIQYAPLLSPMLASCTANLPSPIPSKQFRKIGFGGLGVACWPLVPKLAGSNPAEAVGFLRAKKSSARLPSEEK